MVNGSYMKEYWARALPVPVTGSVYDMGGARKLSLEEGVDSYVPYAGTSRIT